MLKFFQHIINLVFPNTCPGCRRPLLKTEASICLHCQSILPRRLNFKSENLKQRFYGRIPLDEAHGYLLFKSKGITQRLLHSIKYQGNTTLAVELGCLFGQECRKQKYFSTVDYVVPVPLHISKYRYRGFNQSALIAQGLASTLEVELDFKSVIRIIKTATQTKKNRMERWKNVDQIFKVVSKELKGKHVLLVDDVITTGATLESCGQCLLDAGVAKVSIACLALA